MSAGRSVCTMTTETTTIPATRDEAVAALVDYEVKKWGEAERAAAQRLYRNRTYGLVLNALAIIAARDDKPHAVALRRAADRALTVADWFRLRDYTPTQDSAPSTKRS